MRESNDKQTVYNSKGVQGTCLIEDVQCETGCLAISQVSCELVLCRRLQKVELNRRVTHGCSFRRQVMVVVVFSCLHRGPAYMGDGNKYGTKV